MPLATAAIPLSRALSHRKARICHSGRQLLWDKSLFAAPTRTLAWLNKYQFITTTAPLKPFHSTRSVNNNKRMQHKGLRIKPSARTHTVGNQVRA